jgi:general secretion pathway protein B
MSFISEALRKSERQRDSGRGLNSVDRLLIPSSAHARSGHNWLMIGIFIALVVIVALLGTILYKEFTAAPTSATTQAADSPKFAEAPATGNTRPLSDEVGDSPAPEESPEPPASNAPAEHNIALPEPPKSDIPALRQLTGSTNSSAQNLTLQLLVYHNDPKKRFVVINGQHLSEGQALKEGPMIEQITPNGAVLNFQGTRFQIP